TAELGVELGEAGQMQGFGYDRNECDHGGPGSDRSRKFHNSVEAINGAPKNDRLDQMSEAAGADEEGEEPEDSRKWNVAFANDEEHQHDRNRHVGAEHGDVRKDVQPSVAGGPDAAMPTRRKAVGVEEIREEVQHENFPRSSTTIGPDEPPLWNGLRE